MVDGLGYGYKPWKFLWGASRYTSAAVEKLSKTAVGQPGDRNGENHRFLTVFQLLRSRISTHPNEIQINCGHTLARLPRQISTGSAHRGPSNRPRRWSTQARNGENQRFLTVFQLVLLHNLMCPNKIHIVRSHNLARLPRKISASLVDREPRNRPWHGATSVILGRSREHERWKE